MHHHEVCCHDNHVSKKPREWRREYNSTIASIYGEQNGSRASGGKLCDTGSKRSFGITKRLDCRAVNAKDTKERIKRHRDNEEITAIQKCIGRRIRNKERNNIRFNNHDDHMITASVIRERSKEDLTPFLILSVSPAP